MASHDLKTVVLDDLEITGYSVAGEETVLAVPELDVCFDIGKAPDQLISINNVLLTHGHMDHAAGLSYYLSHRNFCGQQPGTVLAPANLIPHIEQILNAWAKLDGNKIPANLVPVKPGDEYQIKPNLFVRVFPTKHSRGSVGYTVIEKRKKLKPEYLDLTGPQIVELKKQNVEIDIKIELPLVTYLGDTAYVDYSKLDYVTNSRILITECTFFETEHIPRAEAGNHMHVNDLVKLVSELNNAHVLVMHTTQRTAMRQVYKTLKKMLPENDYKKISMLMDNRKKNS